MCYIQGLIVKILKPEFMVQEITKRLSQSLSQFPEVAPTANSVFFRTYSRKVANSQKDQPSRRESWNEVCDRTLTGLIKLGKLTKSEAELIDRMQLQIKSLTSGRWLWVGGTEWIERPENFSGAYNCTSTNVIDWQAFGLMMNLAMMGCGTGAMLEPKFINQLPAIRNHLSVQLKGEIGSTPENLRRDRTEVRIINNQVWIYVGDSRQGWVESYQQLLELSTDPRFTEAVEVIVDVSDVRSSGEPLKGFGGVANPVKLSGLYEKCANILNKAIGRQLTAIECCLLIDQAAVTIVAGNIRRSAGMRQGDSNDRNFTGAKENLWQQDSDGNWKIDPERDALRMANHTRVFHRKPTLEECIDAVRKQYYSGEGAIQWAGEAIARSNADIVSTKELKTEFLQAYEQGKGEAWIKNHEPNISEKELQHRLERYGLNPCLTSDTWVHTENGARQIRDLIGKQTGMYVNGELFSTTPEGFFYTGNKPVFKLETKEGFSLRLTDNHQLLKVTAQTQKKQYSEWVETKDLKVGDRILLHNHRDIQPWTGAGTQEEGWLIGHLLSDGILGDGDTSWLSFEKDAQVKMAAHAATALSQSNSCNYEGVFSLKGNHRVVSSPDLKDLANKFGISSESKSISKEIEKSSYSFYCGFLQGLFDVHGDLYQVQDKDNVVVLAPKELPFAETIQRMLARLGIISRISEFNHPAKSLEISSNPYFIFIGQDNVSIFSKVIGFKDENKLAKLRTVKRNSNRGHEDFTIEIAGIIPDGIEPVYDCTVPEVSRFDANGIVAHNCGEILGSDFHCNLSEVHLNQLDPLNFKEQEEAFTAGALSVAALLNHQFQEPRYQYSRELDPIVGVSFTGLFDFCVKAFGSEWLRWWEQGRPDTMQGLEFKEKEQEYLTRWSDIVHKVVWEYCDRHGIKRPNRCTTVQPSGTKSLLTGASPGWHPPKAQRFIRRITFAKNDAIARACIDFGYSVIPSQSDKDENGNLLNDPFDSRCTEWLVEIPVAVSWADVEGADQVDISKFTALTQMDFYLQVQKYYTKHNTSATIELREGEIEPLGTRIYEAIRDDEGYISAALLARFDDLQSFPRMPFEPITKDEYDRLSQAVKARRTVDDFYQALLKYDTGYMTEAGPAGCDSDKCMFPEQKP